MTIYNPYCYYLYHRPTGLRYYGVRYGKGCQPSDLWQTYFTSSKIVKNMILHYGISSFDFKVRKLFNNRYDAMKWEMKFLTKVDAKNNPMWINKSNGGLDINSDEITYAKISVALSGRKLSDETKEKMSKSRTGIKVKEEHLIKRIGRKRSSDTKLKMKLAQMGRRHSAETKVKLSEINTGLKHTTERILRQAKSRSRMYRVTYPCGKVENIKNLMEFCRRNNLHSGSMFSVSTGNRTHHKNFKCIKIDTRA